MITPVAKVVSYSFFERFSEVHISMPTFDGTVICFFSIFSIFNVEVVNAEFSLSHSENPCVRLAERSKVWQQIVSPW